MRLPTMLLVDDDPAIIRLCGYCLEEEGFRVLKAIDSREALHLCRYYPGAIDLLITDLVLAPKTLQLRAGASQPVYMNGLQLMRQILAVRRQIKVILMSGYSDEHLESLYIMKGGWPFLRKPFSLTTLVGMALEMLHIREESARTQAGL
ncbi:MAG: response regulator [Nitrospirae bacterium]|nr:MAG: response regulator [Nitrospirota bacterium]